MILNIYPTNSIPPVTTTTGANNDISNLQFFEALLNAGNENNQQSVIQKAPTQQTAHEPPALHENALLNLSPQALSYLNGIEEPSTMAAIDVFSGEKTSIASTLATPKQQITSIVNEFHNTPLDENTLSQIQGAFLNAGINPGQISLQEVLQILSAPAAFTEVENNEPAATEINQELLAA